MDNNNIVKNLQVESMSHDEQMALLDSIQQSIKNSKVKQKERASTSGKELNVGEVVAPELAERIKLVTSGGSGISEAGVATLTNKRIQPRFVTAATATTLTPDVSVGDIYAYTALASALTINAPIGTPTNGEKLIFRLLDNGTGRTLTWNATYTVIGVTLPTTTTASKTTYVGCIYNANNTRWDVIAVTTQA